MRPRTNPPLYRFFLGLEQSRKMAQNEISRALEALQTIEKLSKEYEGKTERLADIANYILSRDH